MGKALLAAFTSAATATGTNFAFPGVNTTPSSSATETSKQVPFRAAGTLTRLGINVDATGTSRSVTVRKAGVDQALTVTMTDTTAGLYLDTAHTVSVAAGDLINLKTIVTGVPLISTAVLNFMASASHATFFAASSITALSVASTTTFVNVFGQLSGGLPTTEANGQHKHRAGAAQVTAIFIIVPTNGRTTATTVTFRKNTANGNNTISVGSSATGLFEDTAHTDTLATGDLINLAITTGTGVGNFTPAGFGCNVVATAGQFTNDCVGGSGVGLARAAGAPQTFQPIAGSTSATATEATSNIRHGFPVALGNLRVNISANTYTGGCTVNIRKNGADATNTFSIGAASTGFFEDTTHTDNFLSEDDCCVAFAGGTANSITINSIAVTETDTTVQTGGFISKPLIAVALAVATFIGGSGKPPTPQVVAPDTTTAPAAATFWGPRLNATTALSSARQPTVDPGVFYPYYASEFVTSTVPLKTVVVFSAPPAHEPYVFVPWEGSVAFGSRQSLYSNVSKDSRNDQAPFLFQPWTSVAKWGSVLQPTVSIKHGEIESEYVFVPLGQVPLFQARSVTVTLQTAVAFKSSGAPATTIEPPLTFPALQSHIAVTTAITPQVGVWSVTPQQVTVTPVAPAQPGGGGSLLQPYFDDLDRLYAADKKMRLLELHRFEDKRREAKELRRALQDTYDRAVGRNPRLAEQIAAAAPVVLSKRQLDRQIVEQSLDGVLRVLSLLQEEIDRLLEEDDLDVLTMVM